MIKITQTVTQTTTQIETDSAEEAAALLRAMRPSTDERGLVELKAFNVQKSLNNPLANKAERDENRKIYLANGGKLGWLGWSYAGYPLIPADEKQPEWIEVEG